MIMEKEIYIPEDKHILPTGICKLNEKVESAGGYKWIIHMNDIDPWPSIPHAHRKDNTKLVLNLFTGDIFDERVDNYRTSPRSDKLTKKQMLYLFKRLTSNKEDPIAIKMLEQKNNCTYIEKEKIMTIKERLNEQFYDKEKGTPNYEDYITFMIDNQEFFKSVLVPQINKEIEERCLSLEEYSLSQIKKKYQFEKDKFEHKQTPFQDEYNLQNPKCAELINKFYEDKFISYQKRIKNFNYQNEIKQFINDFIESKTEIYNKGGHCKFHKHKDYSIDDICNFVIENANDLYKCYLYLINN